MPVTIINRFTCAPIATVEDTDDICEAVSRLIQQGENLDGAVLDGANLAGANLARANLARASLDGASLARAHLYGATLTRANLDRANLAGANLDWANLDGASLAGANLDGASLDWASLARAHLYGSTLTRASLYGAKLDDTTRLETGETWKEYCEEVLPQLLTGGGKTLTQVADAWECHEWANCPMHVAYDFDGDWSKATPLLKLLRPRIEQFVRLFDAKLLPCPAAQS